MADFGDLPEHVRMPDGRTEPFEPERITRSLFAAGGRVGRPDAFLSQELTESILHFLSAETSGGEVTPADIAEVVGKVVRNLGQPTIAQAYEQRAAPAGSPAVTAPPAPTQPDWLTASRTSLDVHHAAAADRLAELSLLHIYPRDLASAHREGLIELTDLAHPLELTGLVVPPAGDAWTTVTAARGLAGGFVAIDGPEYELASQPADCRQLADGYARDLQRAALATGLTVILNVNVANPPRLAQAAGPLFGPSSADGGRRREVAEGLARAAAGRVVVYWHWSEGDDLGRVGQNVEYVCHRWRSPTPLGPGLDYLAPAVLTRVGLNLGRLVEQLGGPPVDPEVFLKKVGSLTRFAKTAGHVRQDYLRKYARSGVREAFLLDRARLVLAPAGLGTAAAASDRPPWEFARDILKAVRTAAETDRPRMLPVRVETTLSLDDPVLAGMTVRQKLKSASDLQAVCGGGSLVVDPAVLGGKPDLLRFACESVSRLTLCEDS
ncbi:MAG TPA: ATP cone domain-containing protein [Gemmataceae bacterium]|nr:ATP cone domain-containing protein [Gemmataceae bacterium]